MPGWGVTGECLDHHKVERDVITRLVLGNAATTDIMTRQENDDLVFIEMILVIFGHLYSCAVALQGLIQSF